MKTREEIEEAINALTIEAITSRQFARACPSDTPMHRIWASSNREAAMAVGALMWALSSNEVGVSDFQEMFEQRLELSQGLLAEAAGGGR